MSAFRQVYWDTLEQGHWTFYLAATNLGLCRVTLPHETMSGLTGWVGQHVPGGTLMRDENRMRLYLGPLRGYFLGAGTAFDVPVDFRGTPFQISVWQELRKIPYGGTCTYSDIAFAIGRPDAVRAVGAAIGANPLPIVVPCHRVVGKDGKLTGYRGGMDIKARLLRLEGVNVRHAEGLR